MSPGSEAAVLAIDAGTTGVTALAVDHRGEVIGSGYAEFSQYFPDDGWVEHDLAEIWSATLHAARSAIDTADARIEAVGITNQRETVCFWDRETLGAARRAIVWQDRRTTAMCESLRAAGHEPLVRARTGLRLDPYFSGTKIAWVRERDPLTWTHVESGRVAIGTVDSYLVARMSRGMDHLTDATNASRTLLYDVATGGWSSELCDLFGVRIEALPEIVPSYGSLSRTDPKSFLGLDVPITGIAGDQQAALVGQAGITAGAAKCTYGTGSFLLVHTGSTAAPSSAGLLTTVALQHPDGRREFALEGAVFVTGSAVQWLRDGLGIIGTAAEVEALARSVPDAQGVVFVPALTGLGAPDWDPAARGLIIGITRASTAGHLARATLDAIAYQVTEVVGLMAGDGGVRLDRLSVDGGAAANDLLCQLQANALGIPVDRNAQLQTTGLGAAYLAGVGAGIWPDLAWVEQARKSSGVFAPREDPSLDLARWRTAVERAKNWVSASG
jgi:glycerol kinase